MFNKMWVRREIIVLAMLENKQSIFLQQVVLEDEIRDCWKLWKGIRRIGKDEIELLMAAFEESEYVTFY